MYDSGDDARTESERELANFDARLGLDASEAAAERRVDDGSAATLYLDDPTRFAFRDELELAALEQEMKARGRTATVEAGRGGRRGRMR